MLTVILSGGASRRMKRDKAMLPFGGTTLLQYLIDRYSAIGPVAVSVNRAGKYPFSGALELTDRFPDCGPLNGLVSVFAETDAEEVLLTAVDLPFGEPTLGLRLSELRGDADLGILRCGKKGLEPLYAVYGRRCGAAAEACLAHGKKSMFDLLELVNVRYVEPTELPEFDLEYILTNMNTPEEYRALTAKTNE